MKLTMWRVVAILNMYTKFGKNSLLHLSFIVKYTMKAFRGSQNGMKNECHARHEISRDKSRDMHTYIPATYIKADVD